jgi:hypothetical protein
VEASLSSPLEIRCETGAITFIAAGNVIAKLDAQGQLDWVDRQASPISFAPKNIAHLAHRGLDHFWKVLLERYRIHLDLPPDVFLRPGHHSAGGRYWHPETQRQLDAAETAEDVDRIRESSIPLLDIAEMAGGFAMSKHRRMCGLAIQAVKAFCNAMQPQQLHALRRARTLEPMYRELAMNVTGLHSGARWLQALNAYPALLRIAYWEKIATDGIDNAVQRGLPLIPALATSLELPKTAVRRFRGVTPQRLRNLPLFPLAALRFIAALPPHLRPVTRDDYRAAFQLHAHLVPDSDGYSPGTLKRNMTDADVSVLTRGMKRPLGQEHRIDALDGIRDVMTSMETTFGEPRAWQFLRSLSLGRLVDLNVAWHRTQQQATREAAAQARAMPEFHWPGLLGGDTIDLGNDRIAVELTSMQALLQEGLALDHCVGGYYPLCFDGASRIVSLRTAAGVSCSTIEFQALRRTPSAKPQLAIVQHYRDRNLTPSRADLAAARTLLSLLRSRKASLGWPRLPCPPSIEHAANRILQEHLASFLHTWFGSRGALGTAQTATRVTTPGNALHDHQSRCA